MKKSAESLAAESSAAMQGTMRRFEAKERSIRKEAQQQLHDAQKHSKVCPFTNENPLHCSMSGWK